MVVVTRDLKVGTVFRDTEQGSFILFNDTCYGWSTYGEKHNIDSLKHNCKSNRDIIRVYIPRRIKDYKLTNTSNLGVHLKRGIFVCLWREEDVNMTLAEVCEALGKNIRIVKEN